jgi:hypothetical protein
MGGFPVSRKSARVWLIAMATLAACHTKPAGTQELERAPSGVHEVFQVQAPTGQMLLLELDAPGPTSSEEGFDTADKLQVFRTGSTRPELPSQLSPDYYPDDWMGVISRSGAYRIVANRPSKEALHTAHHPDGTGRCGDAIARFSLRSGISLRPAQAIHSNSIFFAAASIPAILKLRICPARGASAAVPPAPPPAFHF